ncbi:MAG: DUF177 domain-containing protein [Myxococcales bacterium]
MADLSIPIHDLDAQGKDFVFALDEAWLERVLADTGVHGDTSQGPGAVEVHAQRNGREILVHGHARARLITECARCLKGLPLEVECDLAALYAPTSETEGRAAHHQDNEEDDDIDPDQPDREFYTGDQVLIDDLVRDYLLLELPMQPKCDLGWECPNLDVPEDMRAPEGVHSSKGFGEGAIDPRLAPLMKLAKKGEREKE